MPIPQARHSFQFDVEISGIEVFFSLAYKTKLKKNVRSEHFPDIIIVSIYQYRNQ